jgi:hypothetical protein
MAKRDGKYDEEANELQRGLDADAVIVIVVGGERGNGVSLRADLQTMMQLPEVLRTIAGQIEADIAMELAERSN